MEDILYVDRIEGEIAVCEDKNRQTAKIPRTELPPDIREGDVLRVTEEGYLVDSEERERRRSLAQTLLGRLMARREEPFGEKEDEKKSPGS